MTTDSPIHNPALYCVAEAIDLAAWYCDFNSSSDSDKEFVLGIAKAALRAFLQSADGKAIREALSYHSEESCGPQFANKALTLLTALEQECL